METWAMAKVRIHLKRYSAIILSLLALMTPLPALALTHDELLQALKNGDYKSLLQWLQQGVDQGKSQIEQELKKMDPNTTAIPGDALHAFDNFFRSMDHADPYAMADMGRRYHYGLGVQADPMLAYAWFTLAMEFFPQGADGDVRSLRSQLAQKLSAEQIAQANQIASEIKAAIDSAMRQ